MKSTVRFARLAGAFLAMLVLATPAIAPAQVAPSAAQSAAYSGLFAAAQTGEAAAIKARLDGGDKINARDSYGRTPLMVAAFAGNLATAGALMDAGADHSLLENDKYDALTIAAVAGNAAMVKLLIASGARADLVTSVYDGTALIASAHLGHVEVVKALIAGKAPLDHVNNLDWTALIEAIVLGDGGKNHTQVVCDLVAAGANVNLPDGQGRTPLTLAKARGYTEMIAILEKAGAK
ncbi:MAG: ankyrin repeat domain-containing protein [Alphaproteobacteria bacterium]|nr:ankyrin repeat domain-containing protein [Alphaproteobacteria bacterium]